MLAQLLRRILLVQTLAGAALGYWLWSSVLGAMALALLGLASRKDAAVRTLAQAAELGPVFGMVGTLVSLSSLPSDGLDPAALNGAISMAVVVGTSSNGWPRPTPSTPTTKTVGRPQLRKCSIAAQRVSSC